MKRTLLLITLLLTMSFAGLSQNPLADITCAPNEILYTTKYGHPLQDFKTDGFGSNFVMNTYDGGIGKLSFDFDISQIPEKAFRDCKSLMYIKFPSGVKTIEKDAFYNCISLADIVLPEGINTIKTGAFNGCTSLVSITIPDSINLLWEDVFTGCTNIKSVTIGEGVVAINGWSFAGCTSLERFNSKYASEDGRCLIFDGKLKAFAPAGITEYTLPDGITSIGYSAFRECANLVTVTIPNSVTRICAWAFRNCSNLETISIPDSVTEIEYGAFSGCASLKHITIGNSVTSIGGSAFKDCSSLTSVTIPNSVNLIEGMAFEDCSSLKSVSIGNSVTSIGYMAFMRCSSLESITIPDCVTYIGSSAFSDCSSLKSVTIPDSVMEIGYGAFSDCPQLDGANVIISDLAAYCNDNPMSSIPGKLNLFIEGEMIVNLVIPNDVSKIDSEAFWRCHALESVTIPDSVTEIGGWAFRDCTNLKKVTFGDSVTSIGDYAFKNCSDLESITIPNSVTKIGKSVFAGCTGELVINSKIIETDYGNNKYSSRYSRNYNEKDYNLLYDANFSKLTIGDNVEKIGNYAFYDCSKLKSITIGNSVTSIGHEAFSGFAGEWVINSKIVETDVKYGVNQLYGVKCSKITIGPSVTSIGDGVFQDCSTLTSVTLPDSVTEIGNNAFAYCSSLTSINIPDYITTIGNNAFVGCSSLTSITLPNSVTEIGECAFAGCSSLTNITIPECVTSIGNNAFAGCSSELIVNSKIVETDYTSYDYPHKYGWLYGFNFSKLTIGDNINKIGALAFCGCSSIKSVTIPDSVTEIGVEAFSGCNGELIINSKIIETDYTSYNCPQYYGWFYGANFSKLTIGDNVEKIGNYAFYDCSKLQSITIPSSVTVIGKRAFENCLGLESVYCNPTTPPIASGNHIFHRNASGRKIYVPLESVDSYKKAPKWDKYADFIAEYPTDNTKVTTLPGQDENNTNSYESAEKNDTNSQVFTKVDRMPSFAGGDLNTFRTWFGGEFMYPAIAAENGIQGRVVVQFIIEKDGRLTNIEFLQSPDPVFNDEVIRVLKKSPRWSPGYQLGTLVRVKLTLPIDIRLQ